jgi:hypothetical protein
VLMRSACHYLCLRRSTGDAAARMSCQVVDDSTAVDAHVDTHESLLQELGEAHSMMDNLSDQLLRMQHVNVALVQMLEHLRTNQNQRIDDVDDQYRQMKQHLDLRDDAGVFSVRLTGNEPQAAPSARPRPQQVSCRAAARGDTVDIMKHGMLRASVNLYPKPNCGGDERS